MFLGVNLPFDKNNGLKLIVEGDGMKTVYRAKEIIQKFGSDRGVATTNCGSTIRGTLGFIIKSCWDFTEVKGNTYDGNVSFTFNQNEGFKFTTFE